MANGKNKLPEGAKKIITAMEAAGINPDGYGQYFDEAAETHTSAFGKPTTFGPEQERMLATLTGQIAAAQPRKAPPGIPSGGAGGRYATSLTGLSQGLNQLATATVNAENRDELIGDPDAVSRYTQQAQSKKTRASQLRAQAQKMPDQVGIEGVEGSDTIKNTIKQQMLEDAKALEAEAERDLAAAEQNTGLLAKARDLTLQKERAVNEEQFRDQFISKFGQTAFQEAQRQERAETRQEGMTERTRLTQERLLESTRERQRETTKRARINAWKAVQKAKEDGEEIKIADTFKPDYIQKFATTFEEGVNESLQEIENERDAFGELPPVLEDTYENLKWQKQFARDVELDATFYEEADFEEGLPPNRYPSEAEQQLIQKAKQNGVPQEIIDAYQYYNRISFNAAPSLPGQGKQGPTSLKDSFNPDKE